MFSNKIRNIALLGAIAVLLAAVGYWKVGPDTFVRAAWEHRPRCCL